MGAIARGTRLVAAGHGVNITTDSAMPQLSWVLPLYRTCEQLPELLRRIDATSALLAVDHEIICVDDACPHGSGVEAERLARYHPTLRVVHLDRNRGQEAALRSGLAQSRGQWCVMLDADLQDPPEAVLSMWVEREALDVVFARRTGRYSSLGRRMTSTAYRTAVVLLSGLPRGAGLYALVRGQQIRYLLDCPGGPRTLLALLARARLRSTSVPIARARRVHGESAYSSRRRLAKALASLRELALVRLAEPIPTLPPAPGQEPA